jgi:Zn-dependent peptidase ImmA (M78 family)
MRRLPRKIDFGLAVIYLRQVGARAMREEADCENDDPTPDGLWDAEADTIYLLRTLSLKRKREVLFHELVHAAVDNGYWAQHGA